MSGLARQRNADVVSRIAEILAEDRDQRDLIVRLSSVLMEALGAQVVELGIVGEDANFESYRLSSGGTFTVREGSADRPPAIGDSKITTDGECSTVMVPLRLGTSAVGFVGAHRNGAPLFTVADLGFLEASALYIAVGVGYGRLQGQKRALETLAYTDALTGLANRRAFDEQLLREFNRCARSTQPLSVLVVDIDFFKLFNDRYGHLAGDACLQQAAKVMSECVSRPGDLLARYGGEEFAAVLPETDLAGAIGIGEAMRAALAAIAIPHAGSDLDVVSLSVGVCTGVPDSRSAPSLMVQSADAALYSAKQAGRNRVVALNYESTAPPAAKRVSTICRLPAPLTTFLGRERELRELGEMLAISRLLTLAGPGGVGKTRLSLQLAAAHAAGRDVWFIDLSQLSDGSAILPAIISTLEISPESQVMGIDAVVARIAAQPAVFVFDNCEHVIEPIAHLAQALLERCESLKIIATSREPLGIYGEAVCRIPTLSLPSDDADSSTALESDAVRLFIDRCRAARPSFTVGEDDIPTICSIVRRLDGIALAIELTAPRISQLSLEAISQSLNDRFRLLSKKSRAPLHRQQTLRALIGWSYELLDEAERAAFVRLSLLFGEWDQTAAMAMIAGVAENEWEQLELLESLVDKSLVIVDLGIDTRSYHMLESTRQFGLEHLAESDEVLEIGRRHFEYYSALARSAVEARKSGSAQWVATIKASYANIQIALRWATVEGHENTAGEALIRCLVPYWHAAAMYREGRRWLERAILMLPPGQDEATRTELDFALATLASFAGDNDFSRELFSTLLERATARKDAELSARARRFLANIYVFGLRDFAGAQALIDENRRYYESIADPDHEALASMYSNAGWIAMGDRRDLESAKRNFRSALDAVSGRDAVLTATANMNLSLVLTLCGEYRQALELLAAARPFFESVNDSANLNGIDRNTGMCQFLMGDLPGATATMRRLLSVLARRREPSDDLCVCLEICSMLAARNGSAEAALRLNGYTTQYRAGQNWPRDWTWAEPLEKALAGAVEAVEAREAEALAQAGAALPLDGVIDLAWAELAAGT